MFCNKSVQILLFQSTPSVGRATMAITNGLLNNLDFNPRPPWGGRRRRVRLKMREALFQSTPSVGRATNKGATNAPSLRYFNPRPPWGGRLFKNKINSTCIAISIHALRGEGDVDRFRKHKKFDISIHALRGEGDWLAPSRLSPHWYFNPRPPWGGRHLRAISNK